MRKPPFLALRVAEQPLRLLALGDSYTIGEGVPTPASWPARLADGLAATGHPAAPPVVVAKTGWTTDELLAAMPSAPLHPPYGLVTLQIGVNDQYRDRGLASFQAGYDRLLQRAIALAGGRAARVLAVSIPDWGVTPFGARDRRGPAAISRAIDAFNACARERARAAGVPWADVTETSRRAGSAPGMVAADDLHPGAGQYALWVRESLLPASHRLLEA